MSGKAKKQKAPKAPKAGKAGKGVGKGGRAAGPMVMLVMVFMLGLLPLAPNTFALLLVFMLPTWLAAMTRLLRIPGAVPTVAGMNISGTLPALVHLWSMDGSFDNVFDVVFNAELLSINVAASTLGIVLLLAAPFIARTWVEIASSRLRRRAENKLKRLKDEWGEDVLNAAPATTAQAKDREARDSRAPDAQARAA